MNSECPICKKAVASEPKPGPYPFCSARCKKVDLYNWLNEEYRVSVPLDSDSLDELEAQLDESNPGAIS